MTSYHGISSSPIPFKNIARGPDFTRVVGDIHGKIGSYYQIVNSTNTPLDSPSIQLGDFCYGFEESLNEKMEHVWKNHSSHHKFIRGNHDNPEKCKSSPAYLGDFFYDESKKLFGVSGAYSTDVDTRSPFINWWPNEELTTTEMNKAYELYDEKRPAVMISHDAPTSITKGYVGEYEYHIKTSTREFLQALLDLHSPRLWIHGHWHFNRFTEAKGCLFVSLEELGFIDVNWREDYFITSKKQKIKY